MPNRITEKDPRQERVAETLLTVKGMLESSHGHKQEDIEAVLDLLGKEENLRDELLLNALKDMDAFGPDFLAAWVGRSWDGLAETGKHVLINRLLTDLPKKTSSHILRLKVAVVLADRDPSLCSKLLNKSCEKVRGKKPGLPNRDFCQSIQKLFFNSKGSLLTRVPPTSGRADSGLLPVFAIRATMNKAGDKAFDPEVQAQVFKWLIDENQWPKLPEEMEQRIRLCITSWPPKLLAEQESLLALLPEGLTKGLFHKIPTSDQIKVAQSDDLPSDETRALASPKPEAHTSPEVPFDPMAVLQQLSEYIRKLNSKLDTTSKEGQIQIARLKKKGAETEEELERIRSKVNQISNSKERLESRLDEHREWLNQERKHNAGFQKDIADLRANLQKLTETNRNLEAKIERLTSENRQLSERVHHETRHHVDVLRNRIQESLVQDFLDLERIQHLEMTKEIGENLRAQMKMIFSKLRQLNISFQGKHR